VKWEEKKGHGCGWMGMDETGGKLKNKYWRYLLSRGENTSSQRGNINAGHEN
jgi:hypothetical protein